MNEDVFGVPTEEKTTVERRSRKRSKGQIAAERSRILFNWLNAFAFLAMVTINALANILPLGGHTSGQVSDMYPSLFTPAGITFSIWGIIYAILGIVVVRQIVSRKTAYKRLTEDIGGLFAISCGLNIGWILCWHFGQITGATLIIFALLVNLILILILVKDDRLMALAFGIYTAWIMVAALASIFVQIVYSGQNMISPEGEMFTILAVIMAGGILLLVTLNSGNAAFSAVGIWAFIGIAARQIKTYKGEYKLLIVLTFIMIAAMLISISYIILKGTDKEEIPIKGVIDEKSHEALQG